MKEEGRGEGRRCACFVVSDDDEGMESGISRKQEKEVEQGEYHNAGQHNGTVLVAILVFLVLCMHHTKRLQRGQGVSWL